MTLLRTTLLSLLLCHVTSSAPVVPAPWGSIQGVDLEGRDGRRVNGYLGIPYALPPTGELRWQKPQPHPGPGEDKVFVADTDPPPCPQELPGMNIGEKAEWSEDCLTMNVYAPAIVTSLRPVMVFIHGGGLTIGEAAPYRPYKLVAEGDVIVITIQYRVAALGFLSTGDDTLPGNLGLWDQNLALRWVKENIRAFGGDPEVVTLFGESAGAWSTGLQMVSPYSKGLFQRVILQSGSPTVAASFAPKEELSFAGISRVLDCGSDGDLEALNCMKTRSAQDIVDATSKWRRESGVVLAVSARVDGDFIPRDPVELVQDEQYVRETGIGDIDVILGLNRKEGAVLNLSPLFPPETVKTLTFPEAFRAAVGFAVQVMNNQKPDKVASLAVEFFYRRGDFGTNKSVPVDTVIDLWGEFLFVAPTIQLLRLLAATPHTGARYLYLLDHQFHFNRAGIPGAHHCDELFLEFDMTPEEGSMFHSIGKSTEACSAEEAGLSDMFVNIVTTFAKTGNPSAAVGDAIGGDWPQFTPEDEAYLSLSLSPHVQRDIMKDGVALWLKLLPQIINATQRQEQKPETSTPSKEEL